jgi:hypothetical protein
LVGSKAALLMLATVMGKFWTPPLNGIDKSKLFFLVISECFNIEEKSEDSFY